MGTIMKRTSEPARPSVVTVKPSGNGPAPKPRLLVVEDDLGVFEAVKLAMEKIMEVYRATSAFEAVGMLCETRFHVVLADFFLPDFAHGDLVLAYVRRAHPHVKTVLMSGVLRELGLDDAAARSGADGSITKPFEVDRLRELLVRLAKQSSAEGDEPAPDKPSRTGRSVRQIIEALQTTGGNLRRAADLLPVSRETLYQDIRARRLWRVVREIQRNARANARGRQRK